MLDGRYHSDFDRPSPRSAPKRPVFVNRTPLQIAFRAIEPGWRHYIDFVQSAASNGDDEMQKVAKVWEPLKPSERRTITPEKLCELADILPEVLVGAVCREIWRLKSAESAMVAAIAHPRVMEKLTRNAVRAKPEQTRSQELFLRTTGSLPDKKGITVIGDHAKVAVANGLPDAAKPGAAGYVSFDQRTVEFEARLQPAARPASFLVSAQQETQDADSRTDRD